MSLMIHLHLDPSLILRKVARGDDTDYFIDTQYAPVELTAFVPYTSRIQCPRTRLILIRTSPCTTHITLHLLSDTDLYSSFLNIEYDLSQHQLAIHAQSHAIVISSSAL